MGNIKNVCVYCGSSSRVDQVYKDAAVQLGKMLACAGVTVVYGGGRLGLMGLMADSVLANHGRIIGFTPRLLEEYEGAHQGLTELHVVDSMHTRKRKMAENADAFVVLPGGYGTLDELFETLTWRQIRLHNKPIIIVNIKGYWDPLRSLMYNVIDQKFATPEHIHFATFVDHVDEVLEKLSLPSYDAYTNGAPPNFL